MVTIQYNKIKKLGVIAVQRIEQGMARQLSYDERADGKGYVEIRTMGGTYVCKSIAEFKRDWVPVSRVNVRNMTAKIEFPVIRHSEKRVLATKISNNVYVVTEDGDRLVGDYIIEDLEGGQVDAISEGEFNRVYSIEPTEEFKEKLDYIVALRKRAVLLRKNKGTEMVRQEDKPIDGKRRDNEHRDKKEAVRYKAVAQLVNAEDKLVGYEIISSVGKRYKLSKADVLKLCTTSKVINIEVVTNENGKKFLRGNGTVLGELPKKRV